MVSSSIHSTPALIIYYIRNPRNDIMTTKISSPQAMYDSMSVTSSYTMQPASDRLYWHEQRQFFYILILNSIYTTTKILVRGSTKLHGPSVCFLRSMRLFHLTFMSSHCLLICPRHGLCYLFQYVLASYLNNGKHRRNLINALERA